MKILPTGKDRKSLLKTMANICGNLSAGWFGFILITPGIKSPLDLDGMLILTISLGFGIVSAWFAYRLERNPNEYL